MRGSEERGLSLRPDAGRPFLFLRDGLLKSDAYSGKPAQSFLSGGETGTAATAPDFPGASVRMDGAEVAPMLRAMMGA